jgi:hypothetical protein
LAASPKHCLGSAFFVGDGRLAGVSLAWLNPLLPLIYAPLTGR